jgi:hypothetical protein
VDVLGELQKEWGVISGAPWLFAGAVSLAGLGIWGFLTLIHAATVTGKNATIESLTTQNAAYKDKLNGASPEQAKSKIDELEARLSEPVYSAWRHVERFNLFEASYLWVGKEPRGGSYDVAAGAWENALCDAIRAGKLGFLPKPFQIGPYSLRSITDKDRERDKIRQQENPDSSTDVSRYQLKQYAKEIGERPKFLDD